MVSRGTLFPGRDAVVLLHAVREIVGVIAFEPRLGKVVVHAVAHEDPGAVLDHDVFHAPVERRAPGRILHLAHLLVQPVELGVDVVSAVRSGRGVGAVEKLQKVLGVRVVGQPGNPKHLRLAAGELGQERGPIAVHGRDDDPDTGHELDQ